MNPIYRFTLSANGGAERAAFPVYGEGVEKVFKRQSGEEFYRATLSGELTFTSTDYAFIVRQDFDTQFDVKIYISYDAGAEWSEYWHGQFWKTDCKFDVDGRTVIVEPNVVDQYTDVLAGMAKEFNLIDLAPEITPVVIRKRPCLQICQSNVGSVGFAMPGNGLYWESECEPSTSQELTNAHFDILATWFPVKLTWGTGSEEYLYGNEVVNENVNINYGKYTLQITSGASGYAKTLTRNSDGAQWSEIDSPSYGIGFLQPVEGTGAEDTVAYTTLNDATIWGRVITDVPTAWSLADDIVYNNRNYRYCEPASPNQNLIRLSGNVTTTPTKYGIKQPGVYYDVPDSTRAWIPVARNTWGDYSIWIDPTELLDLNLDATLSVDTVLEDAYSLGSVISRLLGVVAPDLTHEETAEYSEFLYGNLNPITSISQRLFITPKSNIITANYDNPAQKANITLQRVMDMLRDCFRCFWFVDDQNRFRIEHVDYFRRGGTYDGLPVVGRDLTVESLYKNGKKWAFGTSVYQFEKPEMAARYQFGWMDDVTEPFEGNPIDIVSKYVNPDNIEEINVTQFTSDIDCVLLSPNDMSKDGFMLLGAAVENNSYKVALANIDFNGGTYLLQNGYLAFCYLQRYYAYDMPAKYYKIGAESFTALGIKKLKSQTLNFPVLYDPDIIQLIKTNLGEGQIEKMFVNLSSRNANTTLKYDTE